MTLLRVPRRTETPERRLVTVMFTDVVSSTERAAELGDRGWKPLLSAHHAAMRRLLKRYGGREIATAGDRSFMTFDQPSRAIDCAIDMILTIAAMGLYIRSRSRPRSPRTTFTRADGTYRRDDDRHDNVMADVASVPGILAAQCVEATVHDAFGTERLPVGRSGA